MPDDKLATRSASQIDDGALPHIVERAAWYAASTFRRWPKLCVALLIGCVALLVGMVLLIASPLVLALWTDRHASSIEGVKHWSDIVKNTIEALAVLAAAFTLVHWVNRRQDRAVDVLLKLEEEFKKVMNGRKKIEAGDLNTTDPDEEVDTMLRFYVLLYGVARAKQVPQESLAICFRYWLAHYFKRDRTEFRKYVDENYPTLSGWLRDDCRGGLRFFAPHRLFHDSIDDEFIAGLGYIARR